jgi:hypothetical protein
MELLGLLAWRWLRREHAVHSDVYFNMISAVGLLGAAHEIRAGAWWGLTGAALMVALLAHLVALRLRLRARQARSAAQENQSALLAQGRHGGR